MIVDASLHVVLRPDGPSIAVVEPEDVPVLPNMFVDRFVMDDSPLQLPVLPVAVSIASVRDRHHGAYRRCS